MHARPLLHTARLRALGAGLTLWSGVAVGAAAATAGCASAPEVTEPARTLPVAPRYLLNADDLAPPVTRSVGPVSPARPVMRTAMRRQLTSAVFSPDSERLFAVSTHGELVAYDVEPRALRGYARPWYDGTYPTLQVDRSGSRVLVVATDRAPVLWDLRADTLRSLPLVERDMATNHALHPSGDAVAHATRAPAADTEPRDPGLAVIVTRIDDGSARRVALTAPSPAPNDEAAVAYLEYSPSGARLAVITGQGLGATFTLLNADDLSEVHTARLDNNEQDFEALFRPGGGQLALARPGRLELLDSLTGRVRTDFSIDSDRTPSLQYSSDGRWLAASAGRHVLLVEAETGRAASRLVLDVGDYHDVGDEDELRFDVTPLPGPGGFLARSSLDGREWRYDPHGDASEVPAELISMGGHRPLYSPNGQWLFLYGETPSLQRVGADAPGPSFVEEGAQVSVWGADWSIDGRTLFTRSRGGVSRFAADGMRDLSCGSEAPTARGPGGELVQLGGYASCLFDTNSALPRSVAASPDGSVTATYQDDEFVVQRGDERPVRLRRARTSKVTCTDPRVCMRQARLAPDGAAIGFQDTTRAGSVRTLWWEVYDTRTGRLRAHGTREGGFFSLHMLAGGAFVVSGEEALVLYDARGRARLTLEGIHSRVASPDGGLLAVQTSDHVVHIIDVARLRETERWTAEGPLGLLRLTPDHLRLIALAEGSTASAEGAVLVTSLDGSAQQPVPLAGQPFVANFAGTYALTCEGGRAVRVDMRSGARVDVARCEGRPDAVSEDGAFAVLTVGSSARVHRLADGHVLTLETLSGSTSLRVAYDNTGRWDASDADPERVQIRSAGPGDTAPLQNPADASGTPGLFGLFVAGQ